MIEYMVAPQGVERMTPDQLAVFAHVPDPERLARRIREKMSRAKGREARDRVALHRARLAELKAAVR